MSVISVVSVGVSEVVPVTNLSAAPLAARAVGEPVFHPCGDRIEHGRCGSIEVWADPRLPALGTIDVGFVRFPRRDRDSPSRGTIVAVDGHGPGGRRSRTPALPTP